MLSGDNFARNARVAVYWGPATSPAAVGATDAQGALPPIAVQVPVGGGATTVRAVDDKSQYPAFAAFLIN